VRIGILGGTFNPPHLGHLVCAQEAYLQLGLDRVMLMPARIPPHKPVEDEPGVAHRLELCRLAVQGDNDRFEVSDLEAVRPGPSYTVDTLDQLHARAPDSELFLIVGGDIAAGLPRWREPDRVLSLATLAIATRQGTEPETVDRALAEVRGGDRATPFAMPEIGVSSTMIRDRVRAGQPIKYLVPDLVASYIDRHGLYRSRAQQ
jgi:nicotinate-nucleotide adenylyltransferase